MLDGHTGRKLSDYSIVAFVGGFVFANKIRWRLYDQLLEFIERGGMALGICNGFQTMVRLGLLPGLDGDYRTPRATLAPNDRLGYRNAWVRLSFEPDSPCLWTRGLDAMDLPSRHGEGKFLAESPDLLERMESGGQIAARAPSARRTKGRGSPSSATAWTRPRLLARQVSSRGPRHGGPPQRRSSRNPLPEPGARSCDCKVASIDAVDPGGLVIVEPGVYNETIDFGGKNLTLRSTVPDDPTIVSNTVIDGTGLGDSVVRCVSGEGTDTVLAGFTVCSLPARSTRSRAWPRSAPAPYLEGS